MPNLTTKPLRHGGFTLVELMVTIAVAAILMAVALPSFQGVMRSNRVSTTTNQMIGALSLARMEAIRNTRGAGVCASADGSTCSAAGDWTAGWLVWSDVNGNGTYDGTATDTALRYVQGSDNMTVTGPAGADAIRFDARGRVAAAQTLVLQSTNCGSQLLRRTLTVAPTGQVRKDGGLVACQ